MLHVFKIEKRYIEKYLLDWTYLVSISVVEKVTHLYMVRRYDVTGSLVIFQRGAAASAKVNSLVEIAKRRDLM